MAVLKIQLNFLKTRFAHITYIRIEICMRDADPFTTLLALVFCVLLCLLYTNTHADAPIPEEDKK